MRPQQSRQHSLGQGPHTSYDTYYSNQAGTGLPFFAGAPTQSGYGLGSILGGLIRSAVPLLKPALKRAGKEVARSGLNVVQDVLQGQTVKRAAKRRLTQGAQRWVQGTPPLRAAAGVLFPSSSLPPPPPPKRQRQQARTKRAGIKRPGVTAKTAFSKRSRRQRKDIFNA